MEVMEPGRDWSCLIPDLLVEIAVHMPLIEDFMAFRGVCSSWRAAGSKDKFKPQKPNVPLLMLPWSSDEDENDESGNNDRAFYSLSRRKICMRLALPQATSTRCSGVGFGWILAYKSLKEKSLLNPFSGAQIELPNDNKFLAIGHAVLSADPSLTSDFVLFAAFQSGNRLGFWRVGDKLWNKVESPDGHRYPWFADVVYYKEKFYVVDYHHGTSIYVWDPFIRPAKAEYLCHVTTPGSQRQPHIKKLVESSNGELLFITCRNEDGRSVVKIMRIDVMKRELELIYGLGNDAVFVDGMSSMVMDASAFPDFIRPNRIYYATFGSENSPGMIGYSDGLGEGNKMGIYNVADGSIEWLVDHHEPPHVLRPTVWIAPSF